MGMTMREKIADAILKDLMDRRDIKWAFERVDDEVMAEIREAIADAALSAMREPTPGMVEAGRWPAEDDGPYACWTAMIDAAIGEGK